MRKLTQGNEAVFRGAVAAGASYYAGYPISPSTEILNVASGWAAEHPEFRFLQAEDEIASANAIIGASLAGAKSFTATSGPGFSLMQEAVGYAQKVGVPCVFVNVQRVGPATGMPTMPGQGDIMQVRYGSTGDYTPLAFYPNGVEEAFRVTVQAFNAAEESLSPVVVLSDTFVAHLNEVVDLDEVAAGVEVVPRSLVPLGQARAGQAALLRRRGDVRAGARTPASRPPPTPMNTCASTTTPSIGTLEVAQRYALYEHGWNVDAKVLIICYGIVSRVASPLAADYALFRPIRIHPMLTDELRAIADRYEQIVCIEANDGQYADMVELALRREVKRVPLLGGRISLEAVRDGLDRVLGGGPSEPPIPPAPTERGRALAAGDRLMPEAPFAELDFKDQLKLDLFPTIWCPGCGIGTIMIELAMVLDEMGMDETNTIIVTGIGCTGRMGSYLKYESVYTLHGRTLPVAEAIKAVRPEMHVVVVAGDGDTASIGGNHLIHAIRRNAPLTVLCNNNEIYGLTGGQTGPTTPTGTKTLSSPAGNPNTPINLQGLVRSSPHALYAKTTVYHQLHMRNVIREAIEHDGFSFVDITSQCIENNGRRIGFASANDMLNFYRKTYKRAAKDAEHLNPFEIGILYAADR